MKFEIASKMSEIIEQAKVAIGPNADDDYILNATKHTEELKETAPELSQFLASSPIKSIIGEYEIWDKKALDVQGKFKWWSTQARWAVFLTATASALLVASPGILMIFDQYPKNDTSFLVIALMTISIFFGAWATVCFNIIKSKKLLPEWMENRAQAEEQRLDYFNLIASTQATQSSSNEVEQVLHKLEYFRRYQLEMQYSYYKERASEHGHKASKYLTYSALAMGGVALINGIAGAFGIADPKWTAFAALAIVLQAIASMVSNKESIDQNQRNAERYERTRTVLNRLIGKLDQIREDISNGNYDLLPNFVKAVHEVLSVEHRQWLTNLEDRQTAVNQLEIQLKELSKNS